MSVARARFAPAPSGSLHVGGAWVALFNWLFARHEGGELLLRFEDTDPATARDELREPMLRALEWLGIGWEGEPVSQSSRWEAYREAVEALLAGGHAYLVARGEDGEERAVEGDRLDGGLAVRFRIPAEGATTVDDVIRGRVTFAHRELEDFVIWRSDGRPTFYLANAVDDVAMGITHVIRGADLLASTPRVVLARRALGHDDLPVFAHLPLLVDEEGRKLSKRRGDTAVADFRDRGFLPEALRNYLCTLGWGAPDGVEIRPIEEIVELFDLAAVNPSPARFDEQKLTHFNQQYVAALDVDDFLARARPFVEQAPWAASVDWDRFARVAPLVQERTHTLEQVAPMVDFLFVDEPPFVDEDWSEVLRGKVGEVAPALLDDVIDALGASEWRADVLQATLREVGERHDLSLRRAQGPVRVAVTGRRIGPPLFESLEVLGREEALRRLRAARGRL